MRFRFCLLPCRTKVDSPTPWLVRWFPSRSNSTTSTRRLNYERQEKGAALVVAVLVKVWESCTRHAAGDSCVLNQKSVPRHGVSATSLSATARTSVLQIIASCYGVIPRFLPLASRSRTYVSTNSCAGSDATLAPLCAAHPATVCHASWS